MSWAWAVDPLALVVAVGVITRSVRKIDKKFGDFKDDWAGSPARPGVPARPGIMERMERVEIHQLDQSARLDHVIDIVTHKKEGSE